MKEELGGSKITPRGRICLEMLRVLHDEATRIGTEEGEPFFPILLDDANFRPRFVKRWIALMESISPGFEPIPEAPEGSEKGDWIWRFALDHNTPEMYCIPDPVSFFDGFPRVAFIGKTMGDKIVALKGVP